MPQSEFAFDGQTQRRLQRVEQLLQELMSGRRLEDASIGARGLRLLQGGGLTIFGGSLRMTSEDGTTGLLYFGDSVNGRRIWAFSYETGELALHLAGDTGRQHISLWDRLGNVAISTDGASGAGIARPYLNIPMYPSVDAQHQTGGPLWPATDSTSYVELMHGFTTLWHPRIAFGMDARASGGETEWRLLLSGELIASGTGAVSEVYDIPGWGGAILPGAERVVQVEVRNSTGDVSWVQVDRCFGRQS